MSSSDIISRRMLIAGAAAAAAILATGCSPSQRQQAEAAEGSGPQPSPARQAAMMVYRDPSCGCCEAWARLAREAGSETTLIDEPDMASVKRRLGVPENLASCHTAVVGDYVLEGHVPFAQVERLLRTRPRGVKGIAVPGMPAGSPGMEMPDGRQDEFDVIAFDAAGRTFVFS